MPKHEKRLKTNPCFAKDFEGFARPIMARANFFTASDAERSAIVVSS
jgi:hypothetical protein